MTNLHKLSIIEAKQGLHEKKFSVKELVDAHYKQLEKHHQLNAYVLETREYAYNQAEQSQKRIDSGKAGLVEGIPFGIKDLYCTQGIRTTACSDILRNFIPSYESTVTSNLFAQGGIMLGKTNMDEFAMGSANLNSCFGPVINPWKAKNSSEELVPGGSSGGSAAAVASYCGMAALGSDTGGSVRQPASFCGIVGIKPTYGSCSRYGMIAFASSLDQAGIFTRSVADAALCLQSIMGYDFKDSTTVNKVVPLLINEIANIDHLKGMKIGIPKEYHIHGMSLEVLELWQKGQKFLQDAGAELVEISLPHTDYGLGAYYIIAPAEASSNLARYDGVRYGLRVDPNCVLEDMYELTREQGFGKEVKRRIMIGTYVLSLEHYEDSFVQAQKVRNLIIQDFARAYAKVDAILVPTTTGEAFALKQSLTPFEMYMNDIFTIPASLAGLPCVSVPIDLSKNGLPLGLQIIGNNFQESTVLKIAKILELQAKFNFEPEGV